MLCSKFVAEAFGKEHRNIVGNIENPLKDLADVSEKDMLNFEQMSYKVTYNRTYKAYQMNLGVVSHEPKLIGL